MMATGFAKVLATAIPVNRTGVTPSPSPPDDDLCWRPMPTSLSPAAYDRLKAELEDLTTRGRVDIAKKIEAARALGDLSEHGDYHAAKDSQGHMEMRIRQLESLLKDAVVTDEVGDAEVVGAGSIVRLKYE